MTRNRPALEAKYGNPKVKDNIWTLEVTVTDLSEAGGVHLQLESARESAAVHEEHDGEQLLFGELECRLRRGLRGVDGEVQALLAH